MPARVSSLLQMVTNYVIFSYYLTVAIQCLFNSVQVISERERDKLGKRL